MGKEISYDKSIDVTDESDEQIADQPITWKDFVYLAKPGILFSNLITTFGGFWIASKWDIDWLNMIIVLLGTALVMGSGCVLNNYLDRELDTRMARTKKRPTATGQIKPQVVLWYGIILGIAGTCVLGLLVNPLAALFGLLGLFVYVWIYTAWLKRTSVWCTVVGAVSGAVPPIIGYVAVTQTLDMGAWILFFIMFLWQPPHFWALGILRMEDYRAAGFPMLPVVKGTYTTKVSMMRYVAPLVPVSMLLYHYGYVGVFYLFAAPILGLGWLYLCAKGFKAKDEVQWSKKVFVYSINYLMILFLIMVVDTVSV